MARSIQDLWKQPALDGRGLRWRARIDVAGREVSRSFSTKSQARGWLTNQESALQRGDWISPRKGLADFDSVAAVWLDRFGIRESTRERDRSYLHSMISPEIGSLAVAAIRPDDIDNMVRTLSDAGKAPATVRKASQIVRAVLADAVRRGLISRSPHVGIRLPKNEPEETRYLTVEELRQVVDALGDEDRPVALLGGFGGLRIGEVLGLKGSDIDRSAGSVRVERTATDLSAGVSVGPPKTPAAIRTVALPSTVIEQLPEESGWLFPNPDGELPRSRRAWTRRRWRPAVESIGFAGLRFHDLRHSHVAVLISRGVGPKAIADRLGHRSVRTVLDVYGHLYESADREIAEDLETLL